MNPNNNQGNNGNDQVNPPAEGMANEPTTPVGASVPPTAAPSEDAAKAEADAPSQKCVKCNGDVAVGNCLTCAMPEEQCNCPPPSAGTPA